MEPKGLKEGGWTNGLKSTGNGLMGECAKSQVDWTLWVGPGGGVWGGVLMLISGLVRVS